MLLYLNFFGNFKNGEEYTAQTDRFVLRCTFCMEEEDQHNQKTSAIFAVAGCRSPRENGKSNALANFVIAYLTVVPSAQISLSGRGSERFLEQLPEQLRSNVTLTESTKPQKPVCPKCGARSRMALEFCRECNFNIYEHSA